MFAIVRKRLKQKSAVSKQSLEKSGSVSSIFVEEYCYFTILKYIEFEIKNNV